MTELSFLIDLLLNHNLEKETKDLIAARIREVEENLNRSPLIPTAPVMPIVQSQPAHLTPPSPVVAQALAARQAIIDGQGGVDARTLYKPKPNPPPR